MTEHDAMAEFMEAMPEQTEGETTEQFHRRRAEAAFDWTLRRRIEEQLKDPDFKRKAKRAVLEEMRPDFEEALKPRLHHGWLVIIEEDFGPIELRGLGFFSISREEIARTLAPERPSGVWAGVLYPHEEKGWWLVVIGFRPFAEHEPIHIEDADDEDEAIAWSEAFGEVLMHLLDFDPVAPGWQPRGAGDPWNDDARLAALRFMADRER